MPRSCWARAAATNVTCPISRPDGSSGPALPAAIRSMSIRNRLALAVGIWGSVAAAYADGVDNPHIYPPALSCPNGSWIDALTASGVGNCDGAVDFQSWSGAGTYTWTPKSNITNVLMRICGAGG